jgi:hypothetical protein
VALTRALRGRLVFYFSIYLVWILLIFYATGGGHGHFSSWLAGWKQWDARWYEQIWREGYPQEDPRTLVFPPGYPFVVGSFSKLFSASFLATALALNLGAFFLSAVLISEWCARKFGASAAPIFVFVLSAPAAYFSFSAYSDVLFMLLLWVLLWLALATPKPEGLRVRMAKCLLLLVLPWIRLTGYALASWLFARRMVALAVLGSLALWLGFNHAAAGTAFYFLRAQELFGMPRGNVFQGFADSFFHLAADRSHLMSWLEFGFLPLFYLGALIAAGAWLAKRREGLLALTVFSILLLSYNQGFWRSVVRYDLPLTPVLCLPLLVNAAPRPRTVSILCRAGFYALTFAQFVLQIYFARAFHAGAWAF